jgi:alanyl-tRNA synthetase
LNRDSVQLQLIADNLKVNTTNASERLAIVLQELKDAQRQLSALQGAALAAQVPSLLAKAKQTSKVTLIAEMISDVPSTDALRDLVVRVRDQISTSSAVIALFAVVDEKPSVIIASNDLAQKQGIKAGDLVRTASQVLGGGGGGKPDLAQGGGVSVSEVPNAIKVLAESLA